MVSFRPSPISKRVVGWENRADLNAGSGSDTYLISAHSVSGMRFVSVHVQGGLGNRLFQLLFGLAQARRCDAELRIMSVSRNPHSNIDYFDGILAYFRPFVKPAARIDKVIRERPEDVWKPVRYASPFIAGEEGVLYVGYFQSHHHFEALFDRHELNKMLGFAAERSRIQRLHPDASVRGLFVHIRRGDYKSPAHSVHDLDLRAYYTRALRAAREKIPAGFRLFVISDDIEHCKSEGTFRAFDDAVFIEGLNEVDTLSLMTFCRHGGICANSTFSWFGAYLNENKDKFVALPSRWWKLDSCLDGLYFEGASKIDV